MRGNLNRAHDCLDKLTMWSIPARAGEPASAVRFRGSRDRSIPARAGEPMDPETSEPRDIRSIPARAGEPTSNTLTPLRWRKGLSPRVRGNHAYTSRQGRSMLTGLSPRVRGNRPGGVGLSSIPGAVVIGAVGISSVYPRACGGTMVHPAKGPRYPTCRSIPARAGEPGENAAALMSRSGSIPARAGEPHPQSYMSTLTAVYPRACGGTVPTTPE